MGYWGDLTTALNPATVTNWKPATYSTDVGGMNAFIGNPGGGVATALKYPNQPSPYSKKALWGGQTYGGANKMSLLVGGSVLGGWGGAAAQGASGAVGGDTAPKSTEQGGGQVAQTKNWGSLVGGLVGAGAAYYQGQQGLQAQEAAQQAQAGAAQSQLDFYNKIYQDYQNQYGPLNATMAGIATAGARGDLAATPYGQALGALNTDYGQVKSNVSADLARRGIGGSGVAANAMQNLELQKMGLVTGARNQAIKQSQDIAANILAGSRGVQGTAISGVGAGYGGMINAFNQQGQNAWNAPAANLAAMQFGLQAGSALDKWSTGYKEQPTQPVKYWGNQQSYSGGA